jgi:nicotinate-nucleotide pyrophosphorylase (carboxylating)
MGGGTNHRMGLYDAVLIKDNHLAGVPTERLAGHLFRLLSRISTRSAGTQPSSGPGAQGEGTAHRAVAHRSEPGEQATGHTPAPAHRPELTRLPVRADGGERPPYMIEPPDFVEVEVDDLGQLAEVFKVVGVDVVLLDNFSLEDMRKAVELRDSRGLRGKVALEASGRVTLESIARIAATGVDRISVGALTHSAPSLDIGLDF